jgi:hypothetical protein
LHGVRLHTARLLRRSQSWNVAGSFGITR